MTLCLKQIPRSCRVIVLWQGNTCHRYSSVTIRDKKIKIVTSVYSTLRQFFNLLYRKDLRPLLAVIASEGIQISIKSLVTFLIIYHRTFWLLVIEAAISTKPNQRSKIKVIGKYVNKWFFKYLFCLELCRNLFHRCSRTSYDILKYIVLSSYIWIVTKLLSYWSTCLLTLLKIETWNLYQCRQCTYNKWFFSLSY